MFSFCLLCAIWAVCNIYNMILSSNTAWNFLVVADSVKRNCGSAGWLSGWKRLLPSLVTRVQYPGPTGRRTTLSPTSCPWTSTFWSQHLLRAPAIPAHPDVCKIHKNVKNKTIPLTSRGLELFVVTEWKDIMNPGTQQIGPWGSSQGR